jgi:hypothetical protein
MMKIKNTSSCLAIVLLILAAGLPMTAVADKTIEMDLRFAGGFATGIFHLDPMTGATVPSALIHAHAKGKPGRAEIRGFGGRDMPPGPPVDTCLGSSGVFLSITILENPLIFSFHDLSLLFAKGGSGTICVDLLTGLTEFEINIMFMGGRGRFEGATGEAVIRGEAENVSNDGSFLGETGTIVGWIHVPDDDDDSDSDSDSD